IKPTLKLIEPARFGYDFSSKRIEGPDFQCVQARLPRSFSNRVNGGSGKAEDQHTICQVDSLVLKIFETADDYLGLSLSSGRCYNKPGG
ncbi:hypothetical protein N3930_45405, partial [Bacillus thuringiensis]|nr:hypothetical protein [Bacillus thuringiensis]